MIKIALFYILFISVVFSVTAQITSTKTGNGPFGSASNWDNGVPTSLDSAIINTNNTDVNNSGTIRSLYIKTGSIVNISAGNTAAINETLNMETGSVLNNNGSTLIIKKSILLDGNGVIQIAGGLTLKSNFDIGQ